ncbi:MAG: nucleotidyltransferase domain-containing protein [Candidatus Odinarchaeota archaeon]|nr:nucleotidyltransferase domain-containing protein [Candidatus Odinarchaeota archaeon]
MKVRDRDAPVTREGIIFRVYGYDHPPNSCVCDVEYAPETIYRTDDPRAIRTGKKIKYYKFYFDGGLKFVKDYFPQYQVFYAPLRRKLVGLSEEQILELRRPDEKLAVLFNSDRDDPLLRTMRRILNEIFEISKLRISDFGVFGSILHDFYNPQYSDIDLVIYGRREVQELVETLSSLYKNKNSRLRNEFEAWDPSMPPFHWNFKNYSKAEYGWYQKRKKIYAVYSSPYLGRTVKVEFEPIRKWNEIINEYTELKEIKVVGWIKAIVRIVDDVNSYFMPSIYPIEVLETNSEFMDKNITRIVSFVEEFRMQLKKDEIGIVEGRLEKVVRKKDEFYQITLTYGENYFNQVLKLYDKKNILKFM